MLDQAWLESQSSVNQPVDCAGEAHTTAALVLICYCLLINQG